MDPMYQKFLMALLLCMVTNVSVLANDALKMGVFPRHNSVTTNKMFRPLAHYVSEQVGQEIKIETSKDFPTFWRNVLANQYDIVHYNQLHYILSHASTGYEVFAKNEEYGKSTIKSAIVIRVDTGIQNISDLKGKTIIFGGGKLAMIAYVGVKMMLMEAGLKESDYKTVFSRNPQNSSLAAYFQKADASGVGDIALNVIRFSKRIDTEKLKYLAKGKVQQHLPWAYKSNLDNNVKDKLRLAFSSVKSSNEGEYILTKAGLTDLLMAQDSDYDTSRQIYKNYNKLKTTMK